MAVDISTASITTRESVARFTVFTDVGLAQADWHIDIHFETNDYDQNGDRVLGPTGAPKLPQFGSRVISLRFADVMNDNVNGMTIAQIAGKIQQACYIYRQAAIDAEAP